MSSPFLYQGEESLECNLPLFKIPLPVSSHPLAPTTLIDYKSYLTGPVRRGTFSAFGQNPPVLSSTFQGPRADSPSFWLYRPHPIRHSFSPLSVFLDFGLPFPECLMTFQRPKIRFPLPSGDLLRLVFCLDWIQNFPNDSYNIPLSSRSTALPPSLLHSFKDVVGSTPYRP